ncbi:hypothetical protein NW762_012164 [Fusarium torreyae]|uniref:Uncharacterized protein n=1 Tax=Fusarium torreyae TaxID=1237075 RepID=A0A9W8RN60_9HYPO|nr:hypothetical protein NW762_012164 [Fusarium torreyae]
MHFSTILAAAAAFGLAQGSALHKREKAAVKLYTQGGCGGGENDIEVVLGACQSADGQSAQQDKGENGIRFTCDGFSDSACKNKVGEVYDCLDKPISYINCYANPPL